MQQLSHGCRCALGLILFGGYVIGTGLSVDAQNERYATDEGQRALRIKDICRIKGQEENVLQGLGIVVGLKGTGDGDVKPTVRALTRLMQQMGGQVSSDIQGRLLEKEMANSKNVAAVLVTATLPASGVEQGDKLNCKVSAISAKSLEGGNLIMTQLLGPRADQPIVYALASGPIMIEDIRYPTSGKISKGCKMEQSVRNEFVSGNKMTLVLDPAHSSFTTASLIEGIVNNYYLNRTVLLRGSSQNTSSPTAETQGIALAIDQMHIEVEVPPAYRDHTVQFVSEIEMLPVLNLKNNKRVMISEREGIVSISEDVTIAPVVISHKNLSISTRTDGAGSQGGNRFVSLPSDKTQPRPSLKSLVDALNVLDVPTADKIAIIRMLKNQGSLYGDVIIE